MDIKYYWLIRSLLPSGSLRPFLSCQKDEPDPVIHPPCSVNEGKLFAGAGVVCNQRVINLIRKIPSFWWMWIMEFQFKSLALPMYFVLSLMIWILAVKIVGVGDDDEGGLCENDKVCYNDWVLKVNLVDRHLI